VAATSVLLADGYGRPVRSTQLTVIRDIADLSDDGLRALVGTERSDDEARH
jgi:hypothetical protein